MVDGVRVMRAPQAAFVASQPLGWTYVRWALREGRRADVVHLHVPNMLGALATQLLGSGPKLLVHWHSDIVGKGLLGVLLRPLERAMLRRADRIVCTSQPYAESSETLRPFLHKVGVVPIGARDVGSADSEPNLGVLGVRLKSRRLVLAVGRLVPYKGLDVLVEAAAQFPDDVAVVIVGSGPLQAQLQAAITRMDLHDKVILAGSLPDAELVALFRRASLFCLPSVERSEAFGVVIAEAMAYGLPIVATKIPGSGVSWVNENEVSGLNVAVGDARELAAACLAILRSPELRRRFAEGARRRFVEQFTESRSNARMREEYARLVSEEAG